MRSTLCIFSILICCNNLFAQQTKNNINAPKDAGFTTLKSGLEYKVFPGAGKGFSPKPTDVVEMNINVHIGDSEIFNSKKLNNNEPVSFPMTKPTYNGDPVEGFMHMKAGDSAVFFVLIDSMKKSGAQMQSWMKPGMKMEYDVKLFSVKTALQVKTENEKKRKVQTIIDNKKLAEYFTRNKIKPLKTTSGVYYTISKQGSGNNPKAGQSVTVNYTGKTMNGKIFDSNTDSNYHHVTPFSFMLGKHQVITGWDSAIPVFKKGGKGTIYIPSPLAYGAQSPSTDIPANSILIFDIEVTDIK